MIHPGLEPGPSSCCPVMQGIRSWCCCLAFSAVFLLLHSLEKKISDAFNAMQLQVQGWFSQGAASSPFLSFLKALDGGFSPSSHLSPSPPPQATVSLWYQAALVSTCCLHHGKHHALCTAGVGRWQELEWQGSGFRVTSVHPLSLAGLL